MNKINLFAFALIALAATIIFQFRGENSQDADRYFGDAESIGTEEDAFERINYDWLMLHDPATGKIPAHMRERELAFAARLPSDAGNPLFKTTASTWQSRGPWNVGGRTRAFGIDVNDGNVLIAGSCSGGMWRSPDGGLSWTPTTPVNDYKSVSCLSQDVRTGHTNVWYYGTGEAYGASAGASGAYYYGNGIFKSVDNGLTWNVLPSTTASSLTQFDIWSDIIWNIATNPAAPDTSDHVYAAAYGGIYRSLNGGATWTLAKGSTSDPSYFTDIAISPSGVIYISLSSDGALKGLYRSTNGTTFTNITPAGFPATYDRVKIGISPSDESQVWFLGNTPGYGHPDTNYLGDVDWNSLWKYKYISGDGSGSGGIWEDRSLNLPSTGGPFDRFQSQGSYDLVVKVRPDDTNTVFVGGTNLYRSTSGFADDSHTAFIAGYKPGTTLPIVQSYPNQHPDQHDVAFMPGNPDIMISANDGGLFKTNDNTAPTVSWTPLNNGYLTTMFYTCAIDHAATNDIIIGGAQDNGSWYTNSSVATDPWISPRGGDGSYCAIADNGAAYYFSIQNGKMMRAKLNASGGIDSFARIDPIGVKNYLFINPYVLDPNNNNIMYLAGGKYLWRNNDLSGIPYASNWDSITTNWVRFNDSIPLSGARISALAVTTQPANRVYYGSTSQKVYRVDNANTGTPSPVNITSTSPAAFFPNGYVSSIAVDPNNGDHIMVTFSNYNVYSIFYSDNGGTSWTKVAGNLEDNASGTGDGPSVRWARIVPVNGGTIYLVGTSVGLFATSQLDGTSTVWVQQGATTIGNSIVDMIDHRLTDGLAVAATHSHGIFSSHLTDIGDITEVKDLNHAATMMLTNYPNPFREQTTIRFSLEKKSRVLLTVTDQQGRLVRTLATGEMQSGEKSFPFSPGSLPPGTYYCQLRAGDRKETRKLTILP